MMQKPCVGVIYTGGTIGMSAVSPTSAGLVPQAVVPWLDYIPAMLRQRLDFQITALTPAQIIDSADADPMHWVYIAEQIQALEQQTAGQLAGFVILHGTDTLAYTASALAFMLESLTKPVVCTGAQRPISHPQTDAIDNLIHALTVAAHPQAPPEVMIAFGNVLLRGCRARKYDSVHPQAFVSPHYPALTLLKTASPQCTPPNHFIHFKIDGLKNLKKMRGQVLDITCYPGINQAGELEHLVTPVTRGIILRGYGSGNLPQALKPVIARWLAADMVVVVVSQCWQGGVAMDIYQATAEYAAAGVLSGGDMTPEAALTKLIWLLAHYPLATVRTLMTTDLRGELTPYSSSK